MMQRIPRYTKLIVLLAACSSSGCASIGGTSLSDWWNNGFRVGPNHWQPCPQIAGTWRDPQSNYLSANSDDHTFWWHNFNDPALNQLVDIAVQQNLSLRQAGYRVQRARALRDFANGNFYPQSQTATGGYTRRQTPSMITNNWVQGLSVSWELDVWGKFRRNIEAAEADLQASVENRNDVLICLYSDVGEAYITIRSLQAQINRALENETKQRKTIAVNNRLANEGVAATPTAYANEIVANETAAAVAELDIRRVQTENRLAILLGMPPDQVSPLVADNPGVIPRAPKVVAVGIPSDLIRRRPDVRKAERDVAAQCARVGIAISDLYPSFSVVGSAAWGGPSFADAFDAGNLTGVINPRFSWQVLNYGRVLSNIEAEKARLRELCTVYEQTVLIAHQEVEDAQIAFVKSHERHRYLEAAAEAASKAIEQLVPDEEQGLDVEGLIDLSVYQRAKAANDNATISASAGIATSLIRLYKALGGGWMNCSPQTFTPATFVREHTQPGVTASPASILDAPADAPSGSTEN